MDEYQEILRATFSEEVSNDALDKLYEQANIVTYPPRTTLCRQGELSDSFYVLLKGCVKVYSEIDDAMHHIDTIRHGTFGELGLMLNQPRSAFIITKDPSTVIEIKGYNFRRFAREHPEVVADVAKMVLRRLLKQQEKELVRLKIKTGHVVERTATTTTSGVTHEVLIKQLLKDFGPEKILSILLSNIQAKDPNFERIVTTIVDGVGIDHLAPLVIGKLSKLGSPKRNEQYSSTDVFMMMPFDKGLDPVYEYIKNLAEDMGLVIRRGDEFYTGHMIMEDIWAVTNAAKIVIADCTELNANVFYELGIAHTLGKETILISQARNIPFDVNQHRFIFYEKSVEGMLTFVAELKTAMLQILDKEP